MVNVLAARPSSRLLKKPCGTANPGCAWKIKAIDSALVPEIVRHNLLGIDFFSNLLEISQVREPERRAQMFAQINPVLFRDCSEDLHDFGIELRPGAAANLFAGMGHGQSAAVRAVADHRVERIGDRENARSQGYLVAPEASRIAGAVEKFLVGQYDFRSVPEKRDADKHVVANLAVLPHDLLFVVGQWPRLA